MSKYKGLKSTWFLIVLFLGIGIFTLGNSGKSLFTRAFSQPVSLDELDYEGDINGKYVRTTIYGIYGAYSETVSSKTHSVKSREYVIDAGGYHYMALKAQAGDLKKADALMDASFDFLDEKIGVEELEPFQFEVTGTIEKLPSKSLQYYHDFFDWNKLNDEAKECVLPYYVVIGQVSGMNTATMWGVFIIGVLATGLGMLFLYNGMTGYERAVRRFLKSAPDSRSDERVRDFLSHTEEIHGLQIDRNYLFMLVNGSGYYMDIPDHVVWMYKRITSHRYNGIPTGKTYGVNISFADHKQREITVKNEQQADEVIRALSSYCSRAIAGYSDDLDKLYQKNYAQFLELRYNQSQNGQS
ncbi:MAG: hypothetical protein KH230_11390 [Enterocloster asparagiformis]|nr:hypothetical protein [Enterocloster asparagiformis]